MNEKIDREMEGMGESGAGLKLKNLNENEMKWKAK